MGFRASRLSGKEMNIWKAATPDQTTGWTPSCKCPDNVPVPATVLDIFAGAFTTSLVAEQLGRDSIAIELNPKYVELGTARLRNALVAVDAPDPAPETAGPLFA